MKTLTEKRDALLRRREELLAEWARNKAALLKRPEERTEGAAGETNPLKRVRITGILGELDAELDRLDRLIAEEARKAAKKGPEERAEEEAQSAAGEPEDEPTEEPEDEPTEEPVEEPEAPPELPPALQSRLDSVLRRLEACYPDHTVRGLVQRHRQLSEDLTTVCKQLGYATREDFLTAYGYRIGSWRRNQSPPLRERPEPAAVPERELDGVPRPRPEPSPERELPGEIQRDAAGPSDRRPAPESPEDAPVQDIRPVPEAPPVQELQPMLDALAEKYRDREKPTAMGVLLFENPEYKAQLKTLQNKAQELFGMTLAKYLQSAGILAKKRGRWERPGTPAPAAGQGEDAAIAGLSPAATARLREYYESLNPRFYGTFQDAVQKLEGLEAGCTRRAYSKFYIAGVTACRADVEIPQGIAFIGQGAFQNQTGLETIVLPESLTEIHASAFEGCTGLRRVILPAGLNLVDSRAFGGCAALGEVDFQGADPGSMERPFRVPVTGIFRRRIRRARTAGTLPGPLPPEASSSPATPAARRSWRFPG